MYSDDVHDWTLLEQVESEGTTTTWEKAPGRSPRLPEFQGQRGIPRKT